MPAFFRQAMYQVPATAGMLSRHLDQNSAFEGSLYLVLGTSYFFPPKKKSILFEISLFEAYLEKAGEKARTHVFRNIFE